MHGNLALRCAGLIDHDRRIFRRLIEVKAHLMLPALGRTRAHCKALAMRFSLLLLLAEQECLAYFRCSFLLHIPILLLRFDK